jgi:hypothetical protein
MRRLSFRIEPAVQASAKEHARFRERGSRPSGASTNQASLLRLPAIGDNEAMQTEPPNAPPPKRKRRWLQFSLRTLLVFALICAIGSAWVAHRIEQKRKERAAVDAIIKLGGGARYSYENGARAQPPGPGWLRKVWGENFFGNVVSVYFFADAIVSDDGLKYLEELTDVQDLSLNNTNVTDAGLSNLKGLTQLQRLYLGDTRVSDAGLINVKGLNQLQVLYVLKTKITDAGLINLKELKQLQELDLRYNNVTGVGLVNLKALPNLQKLELGGTTIEDAGLINLKELFSLKDLDLTYTGVTDAGLAHLK